VLSAVAKPAITKSYDAATGVLTWTGNATIVAYLAVLKSVRFSTPLGGATAARTLSLTVTDAGGLTGDPATRTVNVT
jgi:hypothetical protein